MDSMLQKRIKHVFSLKERLDQLFSKYTYIEANIVFSSIEDLRDFGKRLRNRIQSNQMFSDNLLCRIQSANILSTEGISLRLGMVFDFTGYRYPYPISYVKKSINNWLAGGLPPGIVVYSNITVSDYRSHEDFSMAIESLCSTSEITRSYMKNKKVRLFWVSDTGLKLRESEK